MAVVKDWTGAWLDTELSVVRLVVLGLIPSAELLLGGVRRLPTLVSVVDVGFDCVVLTPEYFAAVEWYGGRGGRAKLLDSPVAAGLRAVKLSGAAPMELGAGTIECG